MQLKAIFFRLTIESASLFLTNLTPPNLRGSCKKMRMLERPNKKWTCFVDWIFFISNSILLKDLIKVFCHFSLFVLQIHWNFGFYVFASCVGLLEWTDLLFSYSVDSWTSKICETKIFDDIFLSNILENFDDLKRFLLHTVTFKLESTNYVWIHSM